MRVAVCVDGDNLGPWAAGQVRAIAAPLGRLDTLRTYGDATRAAGWLAEPGFHFVHAGCGKNASDLALGVDAMDLALAERFDILVIASSDGDFSHLATRLRDRGRTVHGIGEAKTPARFRAACSRFHQIAPTVTTLRPPATQPTQGGPDPIPQALHARVHAIVKAACKDGGPGIAITDLNARLHAEARFSISQHPSRSWRAYFSARASIYAIDRTTPGQALVRLCDRPLPPVAAAD
ncbi:NYN domain-containing protein [Frigidibacter sp. MR17.24]|uniref:NYN domain-containing protein n=1 Tax=Frigidibacter sp. MR17.24 TaxID=3127345 RepID=UPI003012EA4F